MNFRISTGMAFISAFFFLQTNYEPVSVPRRPMRHDTLARLVSVITVAGTRKHSQKE